MEFCDGRSLETTKIAAMTNASLQFQVIGHPHFWIGSKHMNEPIQTSTNLI